MIAYYTRIYFSFSLEIAGIHFIILHATKSYPFHFKRNVHKVYNRFPFFALFVYLLIQAEREKKGTFFFTKCRLYGDMIKVAIFLRLTVPWSSC